MLCSAALSCVGLGSDLLHDSLNGGRASCVGDGAGCSELLVCFSGGVLRVRWRPSRRFARKSAFSDEAMSAQPREPDHFGLDESTCSLQCQRSSRARLAKVGDLTGGRVMGTRGVVGVN